jgi:hypothetical protein
MIKLFRWLAGSILLSGFMLLSITMIAYSFVSMKEHDYQWFITIPVLIVLLITGILALPILGNDK